MRSPEARKLLNEVLRASRDVVLTDPRERNYTGKCNRLAFALLDYDRFCSEPHYALSVDLASSTPTVRAENITTTTKGEHFQLPFGS